MAAWTERFIAPPGAERLQAACRELGGCATGDAKITPGFDLPARHVIHTVGPVYHDGMRGEAKLLASCYRRSLEVAVENKARSVAFPAISTGIYGYPFEAATKIGFETTLEYLHRTDAIERVLFIFFGGGDYQAAQAITARMQSI